jgi:hypothetical protein
MGPIQNYRTWYALEPGGAPHNIFGWMLNWALQSTVGRSGADLISLECYDEPYSESDIPHSEWPLHQKSFLNPLLLGPDGAVTGDHPLPRREGERTMAAPYVFPQRSLPEVKAAAKEDFENIKAVRDCSLISGVYSKS